MKINKLHNEWCLIQSSRVNTSFAAFFEYPTISPDEQIKALLAAIGISLMGAAGTAFLFFFLKTDSFTYTHAPMRFNRKTRMVHVFQIKANAEVLSVPWDEIYFTPMPYTAGYFR